MSTVSTGHPMFRNFLLFEAAINSISGLAIMTMPGSAISWMIKPSVPITQLTTELVQWVGGVVIGLGVPLLLAYPNTVGGVAGRYVAYATLGAIEVILISFMTYQWSTERSVFSDQALVMAIGSLAGFVGIRAYCMFVRPQWIGTLTGPKKNN